MDLSRNLGITPACWQLLKGLTEVGNEVTAIPYFGEAVQSLWWDSHDNPCPYQQRAYDALQSLATQSRLSRNETSFRSNNQKFLAKLVDIFVTPSWQKFLDRWLTTNKSVDAVIFFTLPPFLIDKLARRIKSYGVPVILYDGDASATVFFEGLSFRYYDGVDLSPYDCIVSNSKGALSKLRELGARKAEVVYWGVDPSAFPFIALPKDLDVFFFGFGAKYREDWIESLLVAPSKSLTSFRFAAGGASLGDKLGKARFLGKVSYRYYTNSSKVNLNIVRRSHSNVYASSSSRLFELASMRATIVSNPCLGIEEWFEPGKELFIAHDQNEASELYKWLLSDDELRDAVGERAHNRLISGHTHIHMASQLAQIIRELK
jgi:glycosyltransferase involved in cell wall biosynthesis